MRRHDLTNTNTKTFREHLQRAFPETFDFFRYLIRLMRTRRHDLTNTNTNTNTNANTTLVNTCEHWDTHCMSNTWEQQSQPSLSSFNKERHGTAFAILAMLEIMFWRSPVGNRHIWKWGTGLRQNIPPRQNQPDSDKTLILFVRERNINKCIEIVR